MRHLDHSRIDARKFMERVIAAKRPAGDPGYRKRCSLLVADGRMGVDDYDHAFQANSLESLDKKTWTDAESTDLLSLYNYRHASFRRLRESIICSERNRRNDTCPICGLDRVSTLDHFLPQSHFPEYSIHPRNLVPCCSVCNGHKSECWHHTGHRAVWNPYLDTVPVDAYLKCRITMSDSLPEATFHLEQGHIDDCTFSLIQRTFTRLHLLDRYHEAAYAESDRFLTIVIEEIRRSDRYTFDENISRIADIDRETGDPNDWPHVLHTALLQSPPVLDLIRTRLHSNP